MVIYSKFNKSKKDKEMKKIFYILASAIVALGAVACNNQDLDNIAPEKGGDYLAFTATIDNTKTQLNASNQTIWSANDVIEFEGYEDYKFVYDGTSTFVCTIDGVTAALGNASGLTAWYNKAGIDSTTGTAGAQLKAENCSFADTNSFQFEVQNAFLKVTTVGSFSDPFVLTAPGLFSNGDTWSTTEAGTHYIAVNKEVTTTLNYSIGGVTQKEKEITTDVRKVYDLGELTATASSFGIFGQHQGWAKETPKALYLIPGTKTYARKGVTLAANSSKPADSGFKFYNKGVDLNVDLTSYILLKPNSNWTQSSAWFAVYTWDTAKWLKMEAAAGGYYYVNKSDCLSNIIFCRMNNTKTTMEWGSVWNQTSDLKKPTNSNNLYTVAAGAWSKGSGSWSQLKTINTGEIYIGMDKETVSTWVTRWSNSGGNNNITVADYNKTYDIYLSEGTHNMWGFEVYYTVVESGTEVTTK